jgi:hypothetical protein
MASVIRQVADAVVTSLAAGVAEDPSRFVLPFTPVRKVLFDLDLVTPDLQVWCGGNGMLSSVAARDVKQRNKIVEIGILKRVAVETLQEEVDELVELAEQIDNYLDDRELGVLGAKITEVDTTPLYDHNRLLKKHLFVGVLRATYATFRNRGGT